MKNEYANRVRNDVKSTPTEIMNRYMNNFVDDDYMLSRHYIGVVEDNNDPEKLGRCKIRVYNVFDPIPLSDLPWAVPDFSFVGSTKGSFLVPTIGTIVNVYFDRGEIYLPRYTTKVLNTAQLPTNKNVDYPDTMVFFETEAGDSFEINRKRNTATYTHSSGTKIHITATGTVNVDAVDEVNVTHSNNLYVDGSYVIPEGVGPLCALPFDLFTGAPQTGRTCLPEGAPLPSETTEAIAQAKALAQQLTIDNAVAAALAGVVVPEVPVVPVVVPEVPVVVPAIPPVGL